MASCARLGGNGTLNRQRIERLDELRRALGIDAPLRGQAGLGPLDDDEPDESDSSPTTYRLRRQELHPELFDYQADLAQQMTACIAAGSRALLSLPTGAGKTRTAAFALFLTFAEGDSQRAAWLAPTMELVDQAVDSLVSIWEQFGRAPDVTISRELMRDESEYFVWVTTPQAVYARVRAAELGVGAADFTVFDEAHQLGARTFGRAVEALSETADDSNAGAVIGLSATPGRAAEIETEDLATFFDNRLLTSAKLGKNPVATLQRRGVLSRLQFRRLPDPTLEVDPEAARIESAARAVRLLTERQRRVLVFSESVPGALAMAEKLETVGVAARAVHSALSRKERLDVINQFATGNLSVLTNQRLLAAGYDCPSVNDVMILGRVSSSVLFEQIVGRAARGPRTGGTRKATVWDFDDHLRLHGLPKSYYRYRDYDWSS